MPTEKIERPKLPVDGARHRIHKFVLGRQATRKAFAVEMPVAAQVIGVGHKTNGPCIWAIVCVEETWPTESRFFTVLPTGEDLPFPVRRLQHIGTFWKEDRPETWHVFEIMEAFDDETLIAAEEEAVASVAA